MNIIFGKEAANNLINKHTVLELDTVTIGNSTPITTYCVVEVTPLEELPVLEEYKELHANLIENYRQRNWTFCERALENLTGRWNTELDTFYAIIHDRITELKSQNLDESWSYIVAK